MATAVAVAASLLATPASATGPDRFSFAGGCYAIESLQVDRFVVRDGSGYAATGSRPAADPFLMKASALGRYLFYGEDRDLIGTGLASSVVAAEDPGPPSDWRVVPSGGGFEIRSLQSDRPLLRRSDGTLGQGPPGGSGPAAKFGFVAAAGCAGFPEVRLNATGRPFAGDSPFAETTGLADMHNHVSAFEFLGGRAHCGRPWSPYGAPDALVDCPDHFPDGSGAILENLFYGDPNRKHDPVGWPTFADWPAYDSLTHEQTYYRWIERAWLGGERLMVNDLVENGVLCRAYPLKKNSCDEMDAVRLQAKRMYQLQNYIDAQAGGPGEGFFRIVRDPFQARRVINDGKLAVVLGIEESELFGCTELRDVPQCTREDIDAGLREVRRLGVSSLYPIHKFDNAFGGTRFDGGPVGQVINQGQFSLSGHYWEVEECAGAEEDNEIYRGPVATPAALRAAAEGGDVIASGMAAFLPAPAVAPVYPPPPHCNVRGLTGLGRYLINQMVRKGMVIEVDHMSVKARNATFEILEKRNYSGVLSGHEWSDKLGYERILQLGGMIGGRANDVEGFVEDWRQYRQVRDPRYLFGWGFGPDANGLGALPAPSEDGVEVSYPFESPTGDVTFERQVSGQRTFDVNDDATAHYGLLPDWVEELRLNAGDAITDDMLRGAEAYLQTWERSSGVEPERCVARDARIGHGRLGPIAIDASPFGLLKRGGQPGKRSGSSYTYCVRGAGAGTRVVAVFDRRDRVAFVAGEGSDQTAGPIEVGDPRSALRSSAREIGAGLWIERTPPGDTRFVYATRDGRVSVVGVASRPVARKLGTLAKYMSELR